MSKVFVKSILLRKELNAHVMLDGQEHFVIHLFLAQVILVCMAHVCPLVHRVMYAIVCPVTMVRNVNFLLYKHRVKVIHVEMVALVN